MLRSVTVWEVTFHRAGHASIVDPTYSVEASNAVQAVERGEELHDDYLTQADGNADEWSIVRVAVARYSPIFVERDHAGLLGDIAAGVGTPPAGKED